ncbi:MAG: hypothetical protein EWV88_12400, partial [Microcystis wesenbergii Mw_MB_S_20031200_S109D]
MNSAVTNITYTFGGGATGATITGLPAGVTATVSGSTVTISGSPNTTTGSPFSYTVSTTGGCGTQTLTGTITVNPSVTLTLTSAAATTTQTVCVNSTITNITYTFGGGATGATVTGLPAGVTATVSGSTVTISGSPTTTTGSPFSYTITTTGGCGTQSLTGTITVNPNVTLSLTSGAATTSQTVCVNSAITNIIYTFGGGATGATVTGLPTGVTATVSGSTVTISGSPTTSTGSPFSYTVSTTGGCGTQTLTGSIIVRPTSTLTLTTAATTANQSVCINASISGIVYSFGGSATGVTVSGLPSGVSATVSGNLVLISGAPNTITGSPFSYTISTTGGCNPQTLNGTITVNPLVTLSLTSVASTTNQSICINTALNPITYTFGNGATGANVTGLPAGVTASVSGSTVTISGSPTTITGSPFYYTVTTTGGCGNQSLNGTITVRPLATLSLISSAATTTQTVCINNPINTISYSFANGATGATVIGLPTGVTATISGSTVTISGTPTITSGSPFTYTVTTTGGCGTATLNGTITVTPNVTLTLTSAVSTTSQTLCTNSPISTITYTFGGSATGATVSGLPPGVTATVSGSTVSITGSPTSTTGSPFSYTVSTTGGCSSQSLSGTITVNPGVTLTLTSGSSTTNQTVCINTPISNTTYNFGGGATGVTVTGLPAGVTASVSGSTVTISGSPTTISGSPFNYTVTTTGGCGVISLIGTITVNPNVTLSLTSLPATTSQTVCINTSLTTIVYTLGNGATGATVTGLPAGVTASVSGSTVTISGSPTTVTGSPFTYTVTTTGGCSSQSLSGTITVNPNVTLSLTSATATTAQTVCINTPITNIVYTLGNGATGATVTGLPAGVTATVSGSTVTISGSPTTVTGSPFTYTVTTTGGCSSQSLSGTITVNPNVTLSLTSAAATTSQSVCINTAISNIVYTLGNGATGATVTGLPAGVTAAVSGSTVTISGSPTTTTGSPFAYTVTTTGGCSSQTLSGTITVDPNVTLTLTSLAATTAQTICINTPITNIVYTLGNGATGATVTGLPAGVTASVSGSTVTISGSPTTTTGSPFSYTVTTTGGCSSQSLTGTITVNPNVTLTLTSAAANTAQTVCINTSINNIVYTLGNGATGATVTGLPAGVTASVSGSTVTISGSPTTTTGSP